MSPVCKRAAPTPEGIFPSPDGCLAGKHYPLNVKFNRQGTRLLTESHGARGALPLLHLVPEFSRAHVQETFLIKSPLTNFLLSANV